MAKVVNNELLPPTTKLSKFDQVAAGTCPHCSGRLGNEVRGSGIGVTRECSQCHHVWYFYKRGDSTGCKCLTCSAEERKRSAGGRKAQSVAAGLDDANVKTYNNPIRAGVAELADAADLKSAGVKSLRVRAPPPAPEAQSLPKTEVQDSSWFH
jgi:hypothetical protein